VNRDTIKYIENLAGNDVILIDCDGKEREVYLVGVEDDKAIVTYLTRTYNNNTLPVERSIDLNDDSYDIKEKTQ